MCANSHESPVASGTLEVTLDGQPVRLPSERNSLGAIRSYLETLAMERQRILCLFTVDGEPANYSKGTWKKFSFVRVEGETVNLAEMPLQLIESAKQQTADACVLVEKAVVCVLINDGPPARELWWDLARKLKEPLLTLSLLPETICGPMTGCASLIQQRKWQLQQLAVIVKDVDGACWSPDTTALSNALENRLLPWLMRLHELICLWHQTVLAGVRLRTGRDN